MRTLSRLFLPGLLVVLVVLHAVALCGGTGRGESIRSDGHGYYAWLPAILLQGDPSFRTLVAERYAENPNVAGLTLVASTDRYASKYSIGVALMQLPGFCVAHLATGLMRNPQHTGWEPYHYPADGYSLFYQLAAAGSGMLYGILGLMLLRQLLRRFYPEDVVLPTLGAIVFGTSWLHYASVEAVMSHVYSFFLFAAFLSLLFRWKDDRRQRDLLLLGLVSGLIALVRLPNLLIWLSVPFLLDPPIRQSIRREWSSFLLPAALTVLLFLPQVLLWRYATGEWTSSGYSAHEEGFHWFHPQFLKVWFGIKKGLFFYAPVLFLALPGCFLRGPLRRASLAVFLPVSYLISSWHMWWFGGSFGHRAFIEVYVFLAFPIAALLARLRRHSPRLAWITVLLCSLWTLWWMKLYNTREYAIEGLDAQALFDIFYLRWHALRALIGL